MPHNMTAIQMGGGGLGDALGMDVFLFSCLGLVSHQLQFLGASADGMVCAAAVAALP
jgi:hypothetical protein